MEASEIMGKWYAPAAARSIAKRAWLRVGYSAAGMMITNVTLESGERLEYSYDNADRLTGERRVSGGTTVLDAPCAYEKVGCAIGRLK